ncbi:MAG: YARHG domain-containing protein [Alphaproteobacteria bacterium]|nr:YARHG domain-containing protein [Alphaproteobacteria bacterium]
MRRTALVLSICALSALAACGGDTDTPAASGAGSSAGAKAPKKADAAGAAKAGGKGPDPLAGKSIAEICADDSLALIRWDYDQLHSSFSDLCCGPGKLTDDGRCEMDWPFNDVPSCDAYSALRNGIFARYGYPFTKKEWQDAFGKQPWYQRREDFDSSWLTKVATANVQRLKDLEADKVGCMD